MINWIISSSILIIAILIIRHVLKGKISARLQYSLWILVLLRLLIPVNIGNSEISVENLTNDIVSTYREAATAADFSDISYDKHAESSDRVRQDTNVDMDEFYVTGMHESVLTYVELNEAAELETEDVGIYSNENAKKDTEPATNNIIEAESENEVLPLEEKGTDIVASSETANVTTQGVNTGVLVISWIKNAAEYVWGAGIILFALIFVYTNIRFMITNRKKRILAEENEGRLPIYFSDGVDTPCIYGIVRPAIYVNAEAGMNKQSLRHIIEHEKTHYRHGDHIWCVLRAIVVVMHWYNPLVWLAAILSRNDSELACDEGTIRRLGEEERTNYGMTLINMSCQRTVASFVTVATNMAGSKRSIKERISLIAKSPKTAFRTLIAVLVAVVIIVSGTFTGAMPPAIAKELTKVTAVDDTKKDAETNMNTAIETAMNTAKETVTENDESLGKSNTTYTVNVDNSQITVNVHVSNDGNSNIRDGVVILPPKMWSVQEKTEINIETDYVPKYTEMVYISDYDEQVLYGEKNSFEEIYAGRIGMEFIELEHSDKEVDLAHGAYYMYNGMGLEITMYENRIARQTYASCSPDNVERLAYLINRYDWVQVDEKAITNFNNKIEINSIGGTFKSKVMTFYHGGAGVLKYYDGYNTTYWQAVQKYEDSKSITEDLIEDYKKIKLELQTVTFVGPASDRMAVKYFTDIIYPATRTTLDGGDPYKISEYDVRSSGYRTSTKGILVGEFTFECIPEGQTEKEEKCVFFTIEVTDDGEWCCKYLDSDKVEKGTIIMHTN